MLGSDRGGLDVLRAATARLLDNRTVARHAAAREAISGFLMAEGVKAEVIR